MDGLLIDAPLRAGRHFRQLGPIQQYGAFRLRAAFLADAATIYAALYLAVAYDRIGWGQRYVTLSLLGVVAYGGMTSVRHLHRTWRPPPLLPEIGKSVALWSAAFLAVAALLFTQTRWGEEPGTLRLLSRWFLVAAGGMALARVLAWPLLRLYRTGGPDHRDVALFGATEGARALARVFAEHRWMGARLVGCFHDEDHDRAGWSGETAGTLDDLVARARAGAVGAVYITLPMGAEAAIRRVVEALADTTVSIYFAPMLLGLDLIGARWDDLFGHPVVSIVASPFDGYRRHLKRIEDLALTLPILPLLLPLLLVIGLAVRLTSPGPALYRQSRYGLGGAPFRILKFRTMYTTDSDDAFVQARRGDARITPLGGFLRRTSLDELPQFINVLRGEMSVVGPRPAPIKYNEAHRGMIRRYMMRHKIKPGITGLAQVSGCRGETETVGKTERRTALDLEYINTWSVLLDLRILLRTAAMTLAAFVPR